MKHKNKIGYILQQNGVVLSKRNNTRNKVVPLFVEDEYVLYQRKRIFKSHDCFLKQIHKKYNERYINIMSHMLFKNEKEYYTKRKELSLTPLKKDNCYNKTTALTVEQSNNDKGMFKFKEQYNLFPVVTHMYSSTSNIHNNNTRYKLSKQLKDIESYRKKLYNMIHSSEQISERYLQFKKGKTLRRYEYLTKNSIYNNNNTEQHKSNKLLFNIKTIQHTYIK
jgi:hypothetical protein